MICVACKNEVNLYHISGRCLDCHEKKLAGEAVVNVLAAWKDWSNRCICQCEECIKLDQTLKKLHQYITHTRPGPEKHLKEKS